MKRGDVLTCPVCHMKHIVTEKQARHKKPLQLLCDGPRAGMRHRPEILTARPVHEFELAL